MRSPTLPFRKFVVDRDRITVGETVTSGDGSYTHADLAIELGIRPTAQPREHLLGWLEPRDDEVVVLVALGALTRATRQTLVDWLTATDTESRAAPRSIRFETFDEVEVQVELEGDADRPTG